MDVTVKDARNFVSMPLQEPLNALAILDAHLLVYPGHACFYQRVMDGHDDGTNSNRRQAFSEPVYLLFTQVWRVYIALFVTVQRQEMAAAQPQMRIAQYLHALPIVQDVFHQQDRVVVARQEIQRPRKPRKKAERAMIIFRLRVGADITRMQDEIDLKGQPFDQVKQALDGRDSDAAGKRESQAGDRRDPR